MPVLVKIEALGFHWEMGTSATKPYHYCRTVGIGTTEGVSTIDAIYGACYHFIKLYNNKPKS